MKIIVFLDLSPYSPVESDDVSEMFTVSIIRAMCINQELTHTQCILCVCVRSARTLSSPAISIKPGSSNITGTFDWNIQINRPWPNTTYPSPGHQFPVHHNQIHGTDDQTTILELIALIMDAVSPTETSLNIYVSTRRNIPQDSHLHSITVFTKTQGCNLF
jgi:hypothetical protein